MRPPVPAALVIWMVGQARQAQATALQPWLLFPVFGVLALVAIGGAYETLGSATGPSVARLEGGRLVDVGGHRLDVRCTGTRGPTVVLEPGLGESAATMARLIAPAVAHATTVCVYNRAGHGGSDPAPGGSADAARDLYVLLKRVHASAPYVLAGRSLGGMFVLDYARRYAAQGGGVALIDSMHPQQSDAFAGTEEMPSVLARAARLNDLGDTPLQVVSAGTGTAAGWDSQQNDLATLSRESVHRTIALATHGSLVTDRADASRSSRAILDVVASIRKGAH